MATAASIVEKLRASDGKVKVGTATGVMAVVAALALVLALPAGAASVKPETVKGHPHCEVVLDAGDYLFENKVFWPSSRTVPLSFDGRSGSVEIKVYHWGQKFDFSLSGDFVAAAVIAKGGFSANVYKYEPGVVADKGLHAPAHPWNKMFHPLSHIVFCLDVVDTGTQFECGTKETLDPQGPFVAVEATIFTNSQVACPGDGKTGSFLIENNEVTIDFGVGGGIVAGRSDFTKKFDKPADFTPLQYDAPGNFVDLQWCNIRQKGRNDGGEFDDVLGANSYPSLHRVRDGRAAAIACKVNEEQTANGIQHTVVYFEFEDPQFR